MRKKNDRSEYLLEGDDASIFAFAGESTAEASKTSVDLAPPRSRLGRLVSRVGSIVQELPTLGGRRRSYR